MNDRRLDHLLTMMLEVRGLDEPQAPSIGGPDCLSMSRLSLLAERRAGASAAEKAHLAACRRCAGRLAAFAAPGVRTMASAAPAAHGRWWLAALAGLAACLAYYLTPLGQAPPSRTPVVNTVFVDASRTPDALSFCVHGDANCDGQVTLADLPAFILEVHRPDLYADHYAGCDPICTSDMNGDGKIDDSDIVEFLQCVGPG